MAQRGGFSDGSDRFWHLYKPRDLAEPAEHCVWRIVSRRNS
jgi:hypothetical protein